MAAGLVIATAACSPSGAGPDAGSVDAGPADAGPPPVQVDAIWNLRCDSATGGCTRLPAREVGGFDGMGNSVSCTVVESPTQRLVNFRAGAITGGVRYSFSLANASIPRGGGFAGPGCSVSVEEGANTYRGPGGSSTPTAAQPCQVQATFGAGGARGGTALTATVFCDLLANATDPTDLRSVRAIGSGPDPAFFEFFDCVGLSLDP